MNKILSFEIDSAENMLAYYLQQFENCRDNIQKKKIRSEPIIIKKL
jgi:hypothetical protein